MLVSTIAVKSLPEDGDDDMMTIKRLASETRKRRLAIVNKKKQTRVLSANSHSPSKAKSPSPLRFKCYSANPKSRMKTDQRPKTAPQRMMHDSKKIHPDIKLRFFEYLESSSEPEETSVKISRSEKSKESRRHLHVIMKDDEKALRVVKGRDVEVQGQTRDEESVRLSLFFQRTMRASINLEGSVSRRQSINHKSLSASANSRESEFNNLNSNSRRSSSASQENRQSIIERRISVLQTVLDEFKPFEINNEDITNVNSSNRRVSSASQVNCQSIIEKRISLLQTVLDEEPPVKNKSASEVNEAKDEEWVPRVDRRLSSARKNSLAIADVPLSSDTINKSWKFDPKWNIRTQRKLYASHKMKNVINEEVNQAPQYAVTDDGQFLGKIISNTSFVHQRLSQIQNMHLNYNLIMDSIKSKEEQAEEADLSSSLRCVLNSATAINKLQGHDSNKPKGARKSKMSIQKISF